MDDGNFKMQMNYLRVAADLRDAILKRELVRGMAIMSERHMAMKYKMSIGTIRKGIQQLVDEGLLKKEHGRGTFVTGFVPQNSDATGMKIGVMVPTISISFYASMVEYIERELVKNNCQFILIRNPEDANKVNKLTSVTKYTELDGLLMCNEMSLEDYNRLKDLLPGLPVFFIDGNVEGGNCGYVKSNDYYGAWLAVEHLYKQGCKRIAHLGSKCSENSRSRLAGYRAAVKHLGLQEIELLGDVHFEDGYNAISREYSSREDVPDGLFCVTDLVAMGAVRRLLEMGIKISDDVAVVGCSNLAEAAYYKPSISSLEIDLEGMVRLAVSELLSKVQNADTNFSQVVFNPFLRIRESSTRKQFSDVDQTPHEAAMNCESWQK